MSTKNLIRWSGAASMLSGVLYAMGALLHPVGEDLASVASPNWLSSHLVYWVSAILMLFSLVGIYMRQADKTGRLGFVGFILAFIGTVLVSGIFYMASTVLPLIAASGPNGLLEQASTPPAFSLAMIILGYVLGFVLFGISTMRARVFPRWAGLLLIIGALFFFLSEAPVFDRTISHLIATIGDVLFGLGLAWLGYTLWSEQGNVTHNTNRAV